MYKPASKRYKTINGKRVIEIRVNEVLQLFDSRDPAPFRDRDLDDDFTEYIITTADEFPMRTPIKIQIYVTKRNADIGSEAIIEAIKSYFEYQIELKRTQFSKILRMAQLFLMIGLLILFACLGVSRMVPEKGEMILGTTMREGIVIFGWVSMWKPLELLLFDWYPIYDRIRLFRKILRSEFDVSFESRGA